MVGRCQKESDRQQFLSAPCHRPIGPVDLALSLCLSCPGQSFAASVGRALEIVKRNSHIFSREGAEIPGGKAAIEVAQVSQPNATRICVRKRMFEIARSPCPEGTYDNSPTF